MALSEQEPGAEKCNITTGLGRQDNLTAGEILGSIRSLHFGDANWGR